MEDSLFCKYCPCAAWCNGNAEGNTKATGYDFIPDLEHCKEMFKSEPEIKFNEFLRGIFELHGSSINKDRNRFLVEKVGVVSPVRD